MKTKFLYDHGLKQRSRGLRNNQTEAEKILWSKLRNRQVDNTKFRRQFPIGNYILDFVSLEKKLIIELDGEQHNFYFRQVRDKTRSEWFENQGFKLLRFWNNDVIKNTEGVLETIMTFLK
jgi:very-short-patch-repair endonuclease